MSSDRPGATATANGESGKRAIGVVGIPGGWSSERLVAAVAERTGTEILIDPRHLVLEFDAGSVCSQGLDLLALDGLIVKKISRHYAPRDLERLEILSYACDRGLPMFSRPDRIARLVDRVMCTSTLRKAGVPMPPTVVTEDLDEALAAVERYGQAVLKPLYSTKARGMKVVRAGDSAPAVLARFRAINPVLYVQQLMALPGRDLGVVFMGGQYIATYAREADVGSWNTTIRDGGQYVSYEPSDAVVELAYRAQQAFEMDFTSVDVIETAEGPMVLEVSAFGGFRGLWVAHGIDVAAQYADYVLARVLG